MTIYIDVVLIENLIMNYIILLATGIVLKNKISHIRFVISSTIGSIYTLMTYILPITIYSNFFFKLVLSIVIIYVAYNPQNIKNMWKDLLVFYLTSFVFGGATFALIYVIKPQDILMKNGLFLGTYPLKTVILAGIIGFIIIIMTFKIVKSKISKKDIYKEIIVSIENKTFKVKTMIDTGNMLKEPVTGRTVLVIEQTCLYKYIPNEILNNIENILAGDIENIPENIKNKYITKLKFIPFSSLGKQNGMLLGIVPDYVEVLDDNNSRKIKNIIIGIYDKSLTKDGKYRALMGIDSI